MSKEYIAEFCNEVAELDWNKEAYIAQFTRGLHWKVKELLSTKDNIPDNLEAIFAASIKTDNTHWENKENHPKKAAKAPVTATTSTTTTHWVCLSKDPNYVTPEEQHCCHTAGLCIKCSQNGHGIKQCPNGWKAILKETAKVAESEEVFGEEEFKVLPPHREYDIAIDLLPDAKLSPGSIYGMTDAESKALKQHIEVELATGKIFPSTSSAGAPAMKLNDVTLKNVYPLPSQDDLMAKLHHAKIFTKLDLRWGYNNVQIKAGDEWKTVFRTKYGLFEYLVMPFG
ncbi:Retrotransposable element Tf2 protein [Rhizoctonia solani]|uniref:Retrotransposable element Tf2 protein n=1 Tax=Rhizoctonia solani TaxID=456999 RepID=A0A8H8PAJ7_9AGAM|nr:Retrotransposable element Tf2 protein [Rhizoctonia solani]QRW27798.1 Retrotransposable element Tf2 protein [Rhizoctonia solani]